MCTRLCSGAEIASSWLGPFIDVLDLEAPLTANPNSWNILFRTDPRAIGHGTDIRIFRTFFNGYPLSLNLRYSQPLLTWNPWVTEKKTHLDFLGILRKAWRAFMSRWQSFWPPYSWRIPQPSKSYKKMKSVPTFRHRVRIPSPHQKEIIFLMILHIYFFLSFYSSFDDLDCTKI